MKDSFTTDRRDLNKDQLLNEIERVKRRICRSEKKKIADSNGLEDVILAESAISVPDLSVSEITGNLDLLVSVFGLSDFERDLVVLCAGVELDTNFLLGLAEGDEQKEHYATFGMALAFLESPHWSAISPSGPLRFWHIIELVDNHTVTGSRLFLDQRILNFLLGINYIDERLDPFKVFYQPRMPISNAQQEIASRSAGVWQEYPLPVLQYCGNQYSSKRNVAALACHLAGLHMVIFNAEALPGIQQGLDKTIRLWERESLLENKALLLDFDSVPTLETEHKRLLTYWLERSETPLILCCNERQRIPFRKILPFDIKKESASEQADRWQELIQKDYQSHSLDINRLVFQFDLDMASIESIYQSGLAEISSSDSSMKQKEKAINTAIWNTCRRYARPKLEGLAQLIEPQAKLEDVVLPEKLKAGLLDIISHVSNRSTVYSNWGFAKKGRRGLGISAVFSGLSGTGKTLSAEVVANELNLDLYQIDLSSVVSKYIGETEKNLARVFDAAEESGAILLFDEADAIFGKRSEVKDSRDRYANIEVSYLLQRMDDYNGLAILTTNLQGSLDDAFLRRIRFVLKYPFPDEGLRTQIWQRIFPQNAPLGNLDYRQLAKLNITGGNIRSIALNAAFIAAEEETPITMEVLLRATRGEFLKLEKPLSEAEIRGWL